MGPVDYHQHTKIKYVGDYNMFPKRKEIPPKKVKFTKMNYSENWKIECKTLIPGKLKSNFKICNNITNTIHTNYHFLVLGQNRLVLITSLFNII